MSSATTDERVPSSSRKRHGLERHQSVPPMQKIAILNEASRAVLSTFDLDQVLNQILKIARDHFSLTNGAVILLDAPTQELRTRASMGHFGLEEAPLKVGQGLVGMAAKLRCSVYSADVRKDRRYIQSIASTRSEITLPLMVRDEVAGVLDFQSDELDFFDEETIELLTLFATQASIAIQNARLYGLERKRTAQLEAINAIARQATAVLDLGELLDKLCALILQNFPLDHVSMVLS